MLTKSHATHATAEELSPKIIEFTYNVAAIPVDKTVVADLAKELGKGASFDRTMQSKSADNVANAFEWGGVGYSEVGSKGPYDPAKFRYSVIQLSQPLQLATQEAKPGLYGFMKTMRAVMPGQDSYTFEIAARAAAMFHKGGNEVSLSGVHMDAASLDWGLHSM